MKTVGALVTVIGGTLIVASRREEPSSEVVLLSAGTAAAMALVDTVYSTTGRVSPVYLLDALPEAALPVAAAAVARPRLRDTPAGR